MPSALPNVSDAWDRIESWLRANAPADSCELSEGASIADIKRAEAVMGCRLPDDVRESYRIHNGSNRTWLFQQGFLMPLGDEAEPCTVVGIWTGMLDCAEMMKNERGTPNGPIKADWWNQKWIPLTENDGGDFICVDLAPESGGRIGQVIDWSHELAATVVLEKSWCDWLESLAVRLESGGCRFAVDGYGGIEPI
ncbi:MAG: SMI1/KNR4 family protein [Planctomycetaceae bacterium]